MSKINYGDAFSGRNLPRAGGQFEDDTETRVYHIRLHKQRAAELRRLFKQQGLEMGTGARTVLYEWLYKHLR